MRVGEAVWKQGLCVGEFRACSGWAWAWLRVHLGAELGAFGGRRER